MAEQDSPWKEALEHYLEPFLALFFPDIHREIDWTRGQEWLSEELRKLLRKDEVGKRAVDLLVKVWLKSGEARWLLIHLEVQVGHEVGFARRMFVYHYRLFNRYNRAVCSLAILADRRRQWLPHVYQHNVWDCRLRFEFPVVKLLDWLPRVAELEANPNPFAAIVAAHLLAQQARGKPRQRLEHQRRLVRGLLRRGLSHEDIDRLLNLIDWFMALPPVEEALFWEELERDEKENIMPHMTSIEKRGLERGRAEGLREGLLEAIELGLKLRFGTDGSQCFAAFQSVDDIALLRRVKQALESTATLEEIRQLVP